MTRMLVTGGAGFVGANFVHYTLRQHPEYRIRVLDSLTYAGNLDSLRTVADRIDVVVGDIGDAGLVDGLVARCDVVVHFAAESHVDNSLLDPEPFLNSNVVGTFRLLEAVRRHGVRFHHISTDEVYGDLPLDSPVRFTEETAYDPSSPYAATKAASDLLVMAWHRSYGVAATISNCANNYGPYQHVEKFIPRQITNVLTGRRPRLYGRGVNVREWTHVDDHNAGVHLILSRGEVGQTYLIGSGAEHRNREIVQILLELLGWAPDAFDQVPDRPGHDLRYATDSTKIRTQLGWRPVHDLRSGLAATVDWYRRNDSWWKGHKQTVEDRYDLIGR